MKNFNIQSIIILLIGSLLVLVVLLSLNKNSLRVSEGLMVSSARSYSATFSGIRNFYQENVVSRLQGTDVVITHNFRNVDGAIPIPATMMLELTGYLNQSEGDVTFSLVSDYPFPWRAGRNLLESDIAALDALRTSEVKEFYKFYQKSGTKNLYYASPVIMKEGCVACHNSHPDSPKTDWQVGDVRAIQVFDIPVVTSESNTTFWDAVLMSAIMLISTTTIFTLLFVNARSQRTQNQLAERAAELVIAKNETEFQSLHDPLTGLANRRGLDDAFKKRIALGITEGTLIHIDLDHFKNVNDNMGHAAGDFVLTEVAKILSSEHRSTGGDRSTDIVARMGGDEFVILLGPIATIETAEILSRRLLAKICEPMPFGSTSLKVSASFGIASTHDGLVSSLSDLLAAADASLYDAKNNGRNCVSSYTETLHFKVAQQRELALKFRDAVSGGEFEPYFQPQFNAHTGKIIGLEVLARWPSKQLGLVQPNLFLPIARQLYMMEELDEIIFYKAIDQIMRLQQKGTSIPKISFNVTAERVIGGGVLKSISSLGIERPNISIEVLESVILEDQQNVFWLEIEKLRKLGVMIEIDDFGSGHTSLVGALALKPEVLKIDRRLIIPITTSKQAKKIVEQIVGMARIIGLKVTAEGVETIEHAKIATDCGCDILQGYGLALPMPIAELETFLQNNEDLLLSPGTRRHLWVKA